MTDQTSIIRFVEDNWLGGQRIGDGSFDAIANSISSMMQFGQPTSCIRYALLNDMTGEVTQAGCGVR